MTTARSQIAVCVIAFTLCAGTTAAGAHASDAFPQGNTWASIAQLPDFSGSWETDGIVATNHTTNAIPFSPLFQKRLALVREITKKGGDVPSNTKTCTPSGFASNMEAPTRLYEFLFTPGQVTVIPQDNYVRRIYTDGRGHPQDLKLSFFGHSIGHWEGRMLVTDTVGLRPEGEFMHAIRTGPASADMRIVEHIYLTTPEHLRIDTTFYSAIAFTVPYTRTITYTRRPFRELEEVCTQNNVAVDLNTGDQVFPSPPPPGLLQ